MSIGKFKKDELRCIAEELKLVVPDNAKNLDLRELIQEREKANNLMIYHRKEDLSDYNKLKTIVLKEFQPTSYECLNQFKKAQKLPSESYVQFASRLSANFNYYCQLREVNDFRELKSIGVKNEKCNSEEDVSLGVFKQRKHFKNDRYEVELPWKRDSVELSDNFNLEKRQLGSPMRKMQSDEVLYSEYCSDDVAQPVTVPEEKCLPRALLISADEMCEEKRKDQSM
ncbi:integrase catalytic domain-containing protein [Trichonephila clavipes]|nr:integrase catalytic domain-containing protein [Trichonephila clavipes]